MCLFILLYCYQVIIVITFLTNKKMDKFALTDMLKKVAPQLAARQQDQREGDQCTTVSIVFAGICEDCSLSRGYICMSLQCFYSAGATNLRLDY